MPSNYLPVTLPPGPILQPLEDTGYMILENLSEARFGKQLPYVVPRDRPLQGLFADEPVKTRNLCRDLSRLMLSLARVPQHASTKGAARTVGLDTTYTSADCYLADLARFHESGFRIKPNAALGESDADYQMGIMVALRARAHHFVGGSGPGAGPGENARRGDGQPFLLHLSDSNPGNLLVDDDWHITAIFDLEWLFAAPIDQLQPPSWLTWESIDFVAGEGYDSYCAARKVYMDIFREEEEEMGMAGRSADSKIRFSDAMDASWTSELAWFYLALTSVDGMTQIYERRFRPLFWPRTRKSKDESKGESKDESKDECKDHSKDEPKDENTQTETTEFNTLSQFWQLRRSSHHSPEGDWQRTAQGGHRATV
ncbi:hypothetical protein HMPREF1624_01627 [Sporothrix schenckii ATCC 58251]|uniref:Aminoglycoside phosphotransferase domain-containing protein n=1 Tax=Sporothrix schenckii (strain ATCC 58251 / de Perez 2211183) TaxID=1391915 RepID=U7Q957_SPOS1|nr:hypothetical protein HMPREF1624_01627 [Sporothrix schenckii ATCC 58251]